MPTTSRRAPVDVGRLPGWCVVNRMPAQDPSQLVCAPRRLVIALAAVWLCSAQMAHAGDEAAYDDTANCIAVMQTNADGLARRIKAGDKSQEPALHGELVRAGALISRTYLDGMHDAAEAKARLKAAQEGQSAWDDARKATVHQACLMRADAELVAASGPQRFIVERFAQARLKRMLDEH
jgi:hypothetical protein